MLILDDRQFDRITNLIIAIANEDYDKRIEVKHLNNKFATISVLLNMLSGVLKQKSISNPVEFDLKYLNHIILLIGENCEILDYNTGNNKLFSKADLKHLNVILDSKSLKIFQETISSRTFDKSIMLNFKAKDNLYLTMNARITRFKNGYSKYHILSAVKTTSNYELLKEKLLEKAENPKRQFNITKNKKIIDKLYHYLMDNLDQPLKSIPEIAEELNTNSTVLIRGFKSIYGKTIAKFHREKRLEKARDLVFDSDTKLRNIAHECGFKSLAHFSRTFKKHFGVNPSDSR